MLSFVVGHRGLSLLGKFCHHFGGGVGTLQ